MNRKSISRSAAAVCVPHSGGPRLRIICPTFAASHRPKGITFSGLEETMAGGKRLRRRGIRAVSIPAVLALVLVSFAEPAAAATDDTLAAAAMRRDAAAVRTL